ncbi:hypothetical protein VNO78_23648 [Psophocarpus tetragonolobus]|uniref:Uncharacterized protein n=1 Tax=Psophocarpus tetragonolobus TaxID=3891 RepID=A0AAN9S4D0_PSOTE
MVSPTSTTFLLLFILLPLRFSNARSHHQAKKTLVVAKLETPKNPVNVEIYHGVPAVSETHQGTRLHPGRKMISGGVLWKSNVLEAEDRMGLTTTKWKAHCVIGSCNHEDQGKGILNVKHKVSIRNKGHSIKVNLSGLVPLNADYYVPRPHPPKNN